MPFVVPGLSTSSSTTSTPASSSSSSQDSVFDVNRYTENPAPERSGSLSEELRGNPLHKPTETENKNKNEGREEVQSDLLHDLPDWLQDFRENLGDESSPLTPRGNPAPKDQDTSSSSHALPLGSRAKVEPGSGKHSVYTHFTQDQNCDICLKTKKNEGLLQRTCWYSRAQSGKFGDLIFAMAEPYLVQKKFGELITADHNFLSEESESRNNHRYAMVVQDLATKWLQSFPCKANTSQETQKNLMKFLEPKRKPKVINTDNSMEFDKSCEEKSWNHSTWTPH